MNAARSRAIVFLGSSLADLKAFPVAARRRAGFQLDLVQAGHDPDDWKPMQGMTGRGGSTRYDSVWAAIAATPAEAENMKLRARLMMALRDHIEQQGLTQAAAAKLFGVTQPRISDLMRGRIDLFAIDTLVNMLSAAGMQVDVRIGNAA